MIPADWWWSTRSISRPFGISDFFNIVSRLCCCLLRVCMHTVSFFSPIFHLCSKPWFESCKELSEFFHSSVTPSTQNRVCHIPFVSSQAPLFFLVCSPWTNQAGKAPAHSVVSNRIDVQCNSTFLLLEFGLFCLFAVMLLIFIFASQRSLVWSCFQAWWFTCTGSSGRNHRGIFIISVCWMMHDSVIESIATHFDSHRNKK